MTPYLYREDLIRKLKDIMKANPKGSEMGHKRELWEWCLEDPSYRLECLFSNWFAANYSHLEI